jgi:hypothetical protein
MKQHEEPTSPQTFKAMVQQTLPTSFQTALEKDEPPLPWCREWGLFFVGMVLVLGFGALIIRLFWTSPISNSAPPVETESHQEAPIQEDVPLESPLTPTSESNQSNA